MECYIAIPSLTNLLQFASESDTTNNDKALTDRSLLGEFLSPTDNGDAIRLMTSDGYVKHGHASYAYYIQHETSTKSIASSFEVEAYDALELIEALLRLIPIPLRAQQLRYTVVIEAGY